MTTVGWFIGYHLSKYENYIYARIDRDMNEYIKLHPEEFPPKGEYIIFVFALKETQEHNNTALFYMLMFVARFLIL